jgi:hypothetical protein
VYRLPESMRGVMLQETRYPVDSFFGSDVQTAFSVLDSKPSYMIASIIRLENDVDEDAPIASIVGFEDDAAEGAHKSPPVDDGIRAESVVAKLKLDDDTEEAGERLVSELKFDEDIDGDVDVPEESLITDLKFEYDVDDDVKDPGERLVAELKAGVKVEDEVDDDEHDGDLVLIPRSSTSK